MQSNMRGRRASRKSNSSDSVEVQNENSTLKQRKYNMQDHETDGSVSDTEHKGKRKQCFSKNAVMARMNRLRKKKYLENLQSNFAAVSEENIKLKDTVNRQSKLVKALKNEILYLRNVVANSKELGMLLKSVSQTTGLPARSSIIKVKPDPAPQTKSEVSFDNFPLDTRSGSRASESDVQSDDTNFDDMFPVNEELLSIEDDVILSSSMPNELDLALLTSDNAGSELLDKACTDVMMDMNCSPVMNGVTMPNGEVALNGATAPNGAGVPQNYPPAVNEIANSKAVIDEPKLYADVGVCLHVAKKKVSLEFCARCNKNANKAWGEGVPDISH